MEETKSSSFETSDSVAKTFNEQYKWPTIYDEMNEMLETCILMYPTADQQRRTAEKGNTKQGIRTPITYEDILYFIETDYLKVIKSGSSNRSFVLRGIQRDEMILNAFFSMKERRMYSPGHDRTDAVTDTTMEILHVGSRTSLESCQLAYAVTVNSSRKRVTLVIHGLSDDMDWTHITNSQMKKVANPMAKHPGQDEYMRIRDTFHTYLFQRSTHCTKGVHKKNLTEYHDILLQILPVLNKNPGYKLYGELSQELLLALLCFISTHLSKFYCHNVLFCVLQFKFSDWAFFWGGHRNLVCSCGLRRS